ncbi:glycosyltransferase family 4 protein [Patescibacteria group bacterium]|nr:glycosyltransferase family 4 protein [Patescibacteria group bacterium]
MKIAFLNIFNGVVERGSEVFVSELSKRLSQECEVEVLQIGDGSGELGYKTIKIGGIPKIIPQGKGAPASSGVKSFIYYQYYHLTVLLFTLKCIPHILTHNYDWVIPVNGGWQVLICRILRAFNGYKILVSGHAGIGADDRFNLLLGKPDKFIALSPNAFIWSQSFYDKHKLEFIPDGVDTNKFNPNVLPQKINLSKPVVLCVSALLPYKKVDLVIKAVAEMKRGNLLLIGEGPLTDEIDRIGQSLLGKRFIHLTKANHEDMPAYFRAADVFTLASSPTEAFGMVYIEAMACNIPVVGPDDINRRSIIGDAGLQCDPNDVVSYAKTLEQAVKMDFGNKPREKAEEYSWDNIAKQYMRIFERSSNQL